jgi:hypothetical protein
LRATPNDSAHTQKGRASALKTKNMETPIENTAAPSVDVPRIVRLMDCPWCGNAPSLNVIRYQNTGSVRGYRIRCGECDFEKCENPTCWPVGAEKEAMDAARQSLSEWWNARQPNAKMRDGMGEEKL